MKLEEGIFFPNFWSDDQVDNWITTFITNKMNTSIDLDNFDSDKALSVDLLRKLYVKNRLFFNEIIQLFKLFGIKVQVNHGQGIFGVFKWQHDTIIVNDTRFVDVKDFISRHPLLNSLNLFPSILAYNSLFGLVLNQLIFVNPTIEIDNLVQLFNVDKIKISTYSKLTNFEIQESGEINNSRLRLDQLFDKKQQSLIVNKFIQLGIEYVDELTLSKIKRVFADSEIEIKQQQEIESKLTKVTEIDFKKLHPENFLDVEDFESMPVNFVFNKKTDNVILRSFQAHGVTKISQITVEKLRVICLTPGIGNKKLRKIIDNIKDIQQKYIKTKNLSSYSVFLPMIPLSADVFDNVKHLKEPLILSIFSYFWEINYFIVIKQLNWGKNPLIKELIQNLQSIVHVPQETTNIPSVNILRQALILDLNKDQQWVNQYSDKLLNYSWSIQQRLLPHSIEYYLNQYIQTMDERARDIFKNRKMIKEPLTLEALGRRWGITRERVRQMETKYSVKFYNWWKQQRFTLKLLVTTQCKQIKLKDYLNLEYEYLIENIVLENQPFLKNIWLTSDAYVKQATEILKSKINDGKAHYWTEIDSIFHEYNLQLDSHEIEELLTNLNYSLDERRQRIISKKHLNKSEIIRRYCQKNNFAKIKCDERNYHRINNWSQQEFGYQISETYKGFCGTFNNNLEIITVGKGYYKFFNKNDYNLEVFETAKEMLNKHFADGYHYSRDLWLYNQIKDQLPKSMTNDEFYQIFQRLYPNDFVYSDGRNNDIFVNGSQPIKISEQIVRYLKTQQLPIAIQDLNNEFGWQDYTIRQEASNNSEIIVDGNKVFWINIKAAEKVLAPKLIDFINTNLNKRPILSLEIVYDYYNNELNDQIDTTHIYNKSAVTSLIRYLNNLKPNRFINKIDIINNTFIVNVDMLPDIKKQPGEIWPLYLSLQVSNKITEDKLKQIALTAGLSESSWNQNYRSYMEKADLVPVSVDYYAKRSDIKRSPEADKAVANTLNNLFGTKDFLVLTLLSEAIWMDLPDVGYRWTRELFATYATLLGYHFYVWPKKMFRSNCYVLTRNNSKYQSMEDIVAHQIRIWLSDNSNQAQIYDQAAEMGLVPKRSDKIKKCFSKEFYQNNHFQVDEIGNISEVDS
ncbi:sigma factor-like helix-turn-helix DNA-binding protein [Bombilactobacillus bombi]|uniref:sigma factor-like helix-turn-helix DNA-binding protein n=1 Tax=Bombilactobacillus bombi TaxID=1303590 RepID=UPI0011C47691|nr:sigma factor-like helix-turn-helix DNA-binding protein [Bombilactobacillus bombi]